MTHTDVHLMLSLWPIYFCTATTTSDSSQLSTHHATAARAAILQFFDADPEEYTVVFTANASAALRLVGESFPYARPSPGPRSEDEEGDEARSHLVLPTDAHNSVNGLREFARAAGAEVHYLPMDLHPTTLPPTSSPLSPATSLPKVSPKAPSLLVLTAQSNLSGLKTDYPTILAHAKKRGYSTLLDAAALAPTSRISLASDQAGEDGKGQGAVDALAISLYKMLGYPTGVGALVVRKEFLGRLRKRWFSGGSVLIVQVGRSPSRSVASSGRGDWPETREDGGESLAGAHARPRPRVLEHVRLADPLLSIPPLRSFKVSIPTRQPLSLTENLLFIGTRHGSTPPRRSRPLGGRHD